MSKFISSSLLLLAFAAVPAAADTLTVGTRVLLDGDSVGRVYQLLGQPDRIVDEETRFGGDFGERFEYYRDGQTIRITIRDGKVESIEQQT